MMRKLKSILALALVIALMVGFSVPAFATTITVVDPYGSFTDDKDDDDNQGQEEPGGTGDQEEPKMDDNAPSADNTDDDDYYYEETYYKITVEDTDNGETEASKKTATSGTKIIITPDADNGYDVDTVVVVRDSNGKEITVTDRGDGTYSFYMPSSNVTVTVTYVELEQEEEPEDEGYTPETTGVANWLETDDHVVYLNGYTDGTFGPTNNMTRAEVAQMFYNLLLDKNVVATASFSDVPEGKWYTTAITTMATLGLMDGVDANTFEPDRAITRLEFTEVAMNFVSLEVEGEDTFSDISTSDWYYDIVTGAVEIGFITGYTDGTFRPESTITRAEVTAIVNRMLGREADVSYINSNVNSLTQFSDLTSSYWAYYQIMEATNAHDYVAASGEETWTSLN